MKSSEKDLVRMLIDRAKAASEATSYAKLAEALGVTPQTMQQWRDRSAPLADERVIQLADLAGDPPELWLILMSMDQSKTAEARSAWGAAALRLSAAIDGIKVATTALILLAVCTAMPSYAKGMVGRDGFEPSTSGLKVRCSTD